MPELRKDPVVGRWVIISTERGKRPSDFGRVLVTREAGFCPFCEGHEDKTPPEVYVERSPGTLPNTPGWLVRVVSNKFPALEIEGELAREGEGLYDKMSGVGAHEVIIESPRHNIELSQLPLDQVARVIRAIRARVLDLANDKRFRYIQVFKNHGDAAGASLEHPHCQLVATPIVPRRALDELDGCTQHFEMKERCIYCDVIHQEQSFRKRIIAESDRYIALAPFASRFPFETWVLPKTHAIYFEQGDGPDDLALAAMLKEVLTRLNVTLNLPPYNFVIHSGPVNEWRGPLHYHWHIEIMPKLTKVAGFEWGTGFYINPTPPEDAAAYLREVKLDSLQLPPGSSQAAAS
ncbi:MAG: galactose-1-phosphate uridylyltransferase [Candidatus Eisenbacteria bacterium]|nr:galactose-1-phosphate uridylyltransferase [Candidatus Eisenbacteria bacterium]